MQPDYAAWRTGGKMGFVRMLHNTARMANGETLILLPLVITLARPRTGSTKDAIQTL